MTLAVEGCVCASLNLKFSATRERTSFGTEEETSTIGSCVYTAPVSCAVTEAVMMELVVIRLHWSGGADAEEASLSTGGCVATVLVQHAGRRFGSCRVSSCCCACDGAASQSTWQI